MRTLSPTLIAALNGEETAEVYVLLITIDHPLLITPFRFSTDTTTRLTTEPLRYGTVSRGNTFTYLPVGFVQPEDGDGVPPAISLTIDNIDRETTALLRSTQVAASVTCEIVLASAPDSVETSWPAFDLTQASLGATSIQIDLAIDAMQFEPYPAGRFGPAYFAGLH